MHTFKDTPEIAHELTLGVLLASRIEPTRPSQKVNFLLHNAELQVLVLDFTSKYLWLIERLWRFRVPNKTF